jgi:hypothetical protein
LAALSHPNRLFVADAFGTRSIYEVHPQSGDITGTIAAVEPRPTALGGRGDNELYVGDWRTPGISVFDRAGSPLGELDTGYAAASIGTPGTGYFPDFDDDGDVDLHDVARWQECFAGNLAMRPPGCGRADSNGNERVDLFDNAPFVNAVTGVSGD